MFLPVRRVNMHPLTLEGWNGDWVDTFFGDQSADARDAENSFLPSVDVSETDKNIYVAAELPGMDPKEIELTLERDVLTISGERKDERDEEEGEYFRRETRYGTFSRSIKLPVEVDEKKIKADYVNGVLKVTLPKSNEKSKKVIKVEAHKAN
jgi:HSP20 family protein